MKWILRIVAGIVVLVVAVVGIVFFVTSADRNAAKQFFIDVTSGAHEKAIAVMHPELVAEFPLETMQATFESAEPVTEVSFSSVKAVGGRTSMEGVATTAGGCESVVLITILGDSVISFEISPLCKKS